jgi:hypothetical protein
MARIVEHAQFRVLAFAGGCGLLEVFLEYSIAVFVGIVVVGRVESGFDHAFDAVAAIAFVGVNDVEKMPSPPSKRSMTSVDLRAQIIEIGRVEAEPFPAGLERVISLTVFAFGCPLRVRHGHRFIEAGGNVDRCFHINGATRLNL